MKGPHIFLVSLVIAIVITLLTGFVSSTPGNLIGASWYGFPATWLRYLVVGPQYNPWVISYFGFLVDVVLWTVVVAVALCAICPPKSSGAATSTGRRSGR
jgi:hypothetical protein